MADSMWERLRLGHTPEDDEIDAWLAEDDEHEDCTRSAVTADTMRPYLAQFNASGGPQ